jgi:hypothetical protein
MIVLAKILGISAPLSAATAVYFIFKFLDKKASGAATRAIAAWIVGSKYEEIDLKIAIIRSFESLYGPRILSFKTLFRSVVYSSFSLLIFVFLTKPHDWPVVDYVKQNSSSLQIIYSILFRGMAPALIVHLWLPIFLLSAVLNACLIKFFKAVRWAQWFIKRGAQHPLEAKV